MLYYMLAGAAVELIEIVPGAVDSEEGARVASVLRICHFDFLPALRRMTV